MKIKMLICFLGIIIINVKCSVSKSIITKVDELNIEILNPIISPLKIIEGDIAEIKVIVKNCGDKSVKLIGVRSSCGCLIPEWYQGEISPQNESEIKLKFYTEGKGAINGKINEYKIWILLNNLEKEINLETVVFLK